MHLGRTKTQKKKASKATLGVFGSVKPRNSQAINLVDEDDVVALCDSKFGGIRAECHARYGVVLRTFRVRLHSIRPEKQRTDERATEK